MHPRAVADKALRLSEHGLIDREVTQITGASIAVSASGGPASAERRKRNGDTRILHVVTARRSMKRHMRIFLAATLATGVYRGIGGVYSHCPLHAATYGRA